MNRTFCDRCKKEITLANFGMPRFEYIAMSHDPLAPKRYADLCKKCATEFEDFLKGYSVDAVRD